MQTGSRGEVGEVLSSRIAPYRQLYNMLHIHLLMLQSRIIWKCPQAIPLLQTAGVLCLLFDVSFMHETIKAAGTHISKNCSASGGSTSRPVNGLEPSILQFVVPPLRMFIV